MTAEPATLEYRTPRYRSVIVFYFVYFFMLCVPATGMGWMIFAWVPSFAGTFKDFKTDLPEITVFLMNFAQWCRSPLVWPLMIAGMLVAPWLLAKLTVRFKNSTQRMTAAMMIMMVLMFLTFSSWMFVQVALMMPLVKLIQSVSGGDDKGG